MTRRPEPMDRVSFEVDHLCDIDPDVTATHTVTGWQTATPGLAVFRNAGPNVPCSPDGDADDPAYGGWLVWNTTSRHMVMGAGDPEAAMFYADRLGRYRNWETAPDVSTPLGEMLDDMARRGEL